eukprot:gene11903-24935_t
MTAAKRGGDAPGGRGVLGSALALLKALPDNPGSAHDQIPVPSAAGRVCSDRQRRLPAAQIPGGALYDFPDAVTLRSLRFPTKEFSNSTDTSTVSLNDGKIVSRWGAFTWQAADIATDRACFVPIKAPSSFCWKVASPTSIEVTQRWTDASGMAQSMSMALTRLKYLRTLFLATLVVSLGSATSGCDVGSKSRKAVLSVAAVHEIERHLQMPKGAHPLKDYVRYYTEVSENGNSFVDATFLYDATGGRILIVGPGDRPSIFDGGCDVVVMRYSIPKKHFISIACNGLA